MAVRPRFAVDHVLARLGGITPGADVDLQQVAVAAFAVQGAVGQLDLGLQPHRAPILAHQLDRLAGRAVLALDPSLDGEGEDLAVVAEPPAVAVAPVEAGGVEQAVRLVRVVGVVGIVAPLRRREARAGHRKHHRLAEPEVHAVVHFVGVDRQRQRLAEAQVAEHVALGLVGLIDRERDRDLVDRDLLQHVAAGRLVLLVERVVVAGGVDVVQVHFAGDDLELNGLDVGDAGDHAVDVGKLLAARVHLVEVGVALMHLGGVGDLDQRPRLHGRPRFAILLQVPVAVLILPVIGLQGQVPTVVAPLLGQRVGLRVVLDVELLQVVPRQIGVPVAARRFAHLGQHHRIG